MLHPRHQPSRTTACSAELAARLRASLVVRKSIKAKPVATPRRTLAAKISATRHGKIAVKLVLPAIVRIPAEPTANLTSAVKAAVSQTAVTITARAAATEMTTRAAPTRTVRLMTVTTKVLKAKMVKAAAETIVGTTARMARTVVKTVTALSVMLKITAIKKTRLSRKPHKRLLLKNPVLTIPVASHAAPVIGMVHPPRPRHLLRLPARAPAMSGIRRTLSQKQPVTTLT